MTIRKVGTTEASIRLSEEIHEAAYLKWEAAGRPVDTALDDWLWAEARIRGASAKETEANVSAKTTDPKKGRQPANKK